MPEVFNTSRRPWIDVAVVDTPAKEARLREVVGLCPSGALHMEEHADEILVLRDNPEEGQFEAELDGKVVGVAQYELPEGVIVFTHTIVRPEVGGRGIGSALADYALNQVREEGTRKVVPACPFIKAHIERHPEFAELVYTGE